MIDIIIPIFNAYEELIMCIESIEKQTNSHEYRLILIDDNSSDDRVKKFLLSNRKPNWILHFNDDNKGFSWNVNFGIGKSNINDVILLNSDTIVTKNWLNKIVEVAYIYPSCATVTPLTNNGTICSVPNFMEENNIPENYTIDSFSEVIELTSMKIFPEIPVAVGFCMFIKREAINEVGLFDVKTFGRGYGEENDFCYRAKKLGWRHFLCDSCFIYHSGSASFPTEVKNDLMKKNQEILINRHRALFEETVYFVEKNPIKQIQNNVRFAINNYTKKKNILYLLHIGFDFGIDSSYGGVQEHTKDLIYGNNKYNFFVFAYNNVTEKYILKKYVNNYIVEEYVFGLQQKILPFEISNKEYKDILKNILVNFRIDLVHVQHTLFHSFDIFYLSKELEIPLLFTIHDYYYVSKNYNLMSLDGKYCGNIEDKEERMNCIISNSIETRETYIKWQNKCNEIFKMCDKIFVPSMSVVNQYKKFYNSSLNFEVIAHGTKEYSTEYTPSDEIKNIAFIGVMTKYKGSLIAKKLIEENHNLNCHVFGKIADKDLLDLNSPNFFKHGEYSKEDINILLETNKIDIVLILSIWPETYCYTLDETIKSNIPVIVTDLGALPERVYKYKAGWIVKHDITSFEISKKINEIRKDRSNYKKIVNNLKKSKLKTISEMINEYSIEYEYFLKKTDAIYPKGNVNLTDLLKSQDYDKELLYEKNLFLEKEINEIKSSKGYKIINIIKKSYFYKYKDGIFNIYKKLLKKG